MNDKQIKLVIGSLLHDFGKLLPTEDGGRDHSVRGWDHLRELPQFKDENDILDCVKYHHSSMIKSSPPDGSSICYITYIADNIAAAADRRSKENADGGSVKNIASESVFNILKGNNGKSIYSPKVISDNRINYPTENNVTFSESFYSQIVNDITDSLKSMTLDKEYLNSLMQILRLDLSYVPSSAQTGELRDISLYDHVKLTAALALCIEQYLTENSIFDYKSELFDNSESFYDKKAFRLYSLDMSGIQDFIYNISSERALKGLRARSFYLEILLEDIVDELLDRTDLCRANVLYTGGGHTYIMMPATENVRARIEGFETELGKWFVDTFGTALFAAGGFADCSANELENIPDGSYRDIFRRVSAMLSQKKLSRYSANELRQLNLPDSRSDHSRECSICHRSDRLTNDNKCSICAGLEKLSDSIIGNGDHFFAVMRKTANTGNVPLPFGCCLEAYPRDKMTEIINSDNDYVRSYSKNKGFTGQSVPWQLWVGDYAEHKDFSELINKKGIERLAVIRADVDNLGQAFVNGFSETGGGKYETISRTSAFSAKLSEFFKLHINYLLENGEFDLFDEQKTSFRRNAVIVYSGGDDLFVVGSWDDIIGFSVDLYRSLKKYSQGTLTFSAGIGIYPLKYPIYAMAEQTGELEDAAKSYNDGSKNAAALFDKSCVHSWDELIDNVIGEKLRTIKEYLKNSNEHGKAMLYRMLELIRERDDDDRLNIARFAYLIARLKPDKIKAKPEDMENYSRFAERMYRWIQDKEECRRLVTAIYIYIYMNREKNNESGEKANENY